MILFLIGMPGVGKSTLGRKWAEEHHLKFIDLDEAITSVINDTIASYIYNNGEDNFRKIERTTLIQLIYQHQNTATLISCGGGTPCFFNNIQLMKEHGRIIWINAALKTIAKHIYNDNNERPLLANNGQIDDLEQRLTTIFQNREKYYQQADIELTVDDEIHRKFAIYWSSLNNNHYE